MTFTQIATRIKNYCNLSSTEADTRVGIAINAHYRRITSMLGLDASRFTTITATTTNGQQYVVFAELEKIDRIIDSTDSSSIRLLPEVSLHDIRSAQAGTGQPTKWALRNTDADSVTVLLDTAPQTTYTLQADGWTTLSDLSGSNEPVFPESFHDILTWYVIAEELLKKEKMQLAAAYEGKANQLLSDLRFHLADSHTRDTRQASSGVSLGSGGTGGGSASLGGTAYTQSALVSFEQNTLRLLDTDESHGVTVNIGSDLSADRILTITPGDAARTITLSGNPTLADWFDQSVKAADSPTFALPILSTGAVIGAATTSGIRLDLETGTLAVREGDDSAYGPLKALTLEATSNAVVGGTLAVTGVGTFTAQSVHNAGINLSGAGAGQIVFPAAQNASSNVNTLDDYEEGSWTPVIGGSGGTSGQAYTTAVGRYVKIGKLVVCQFTVTLSTEGTITGNAQLQGLPFTVDNVSSLGGAVALYFESLATNWNLVMAMVQPNTTYADIRGLQAAATSSGTALTAADIGNSTQLIGTISYRASA